MAFASCVCRSAILAKKIDLGKTTRTQHDVGLDKRFIFSMISNKSGIFSQAMAEGGVDLQRKWSFLQGSGLIRSPRPARFILNGKGLRVHASSLVYSKIASSVFTLGTVAVLPFYGLMVLAPKAELTRRSMQSNIPYIVLGLLYVFALYLSWTPETLRLIFASKHWLPELPGILKMFSSEMTLASAWIHLLAVDLFAARQVFYDGLNNQIETRHSVFLCLFFCPIGILIHTITKALTRSTETLHMAVETAEPNS